MMTLVAERLALQALYIEIPGSSSGKTNLKNELFKIGFRLSAPGNKICMVLIVKGVS